MLGGSQKLSSMFLMQYIPLCKLSLGGDKCGGNFNKSNTFIKTSTSHTSGGESSKLEASN